tara:strand:+ start:980 stop:1822 length:843 start_codon:yes stop_codon:yes gene_type:complete
MAFKMKGFSGFKQSSPTKNYKNPQEYKAFNMGNKPTPVETDEDGSPLPFTGEYVDLVDPETGDIVSSTRQNKPIKKTQHSSEAQERLQKIPVEDREAEFDPQGVALSDDYKYPKLRTDKETGETKQYNPVTRLEGYDKYMAMKGEHVQSPYEKTRMKGGKYLAKGGEDAEKYWKQYQKDNPDTWEADMNQYLERRGKGLNLQQFPTTKFDKKKLRELAKKESKAGENIKDAADLEYFSKKTQRGGSYLHPDEGGGIEPINPKDLEQWQKTTSRRISGDKE